jgi:hypothetical protein
MKNNNWKTNRVVLKILELQKEYEFHFAFAGTATWGKTNVWNMWTCDCCGNLTIRTENLYHKDHENISAISICPVCSELWRAVGAMNTDWHEEILKSYHVTEDYIERWLKANPKPDDFEGDKYMYAYQGIPLKHK